ncbi:ribose-phosphate pyrophosphokinase [Desulfurispirillum indicum S5]|uniref:Ribose-phosphate pyrophosphokinase n=1 Tax=Desulfurispirillum indicum (strain ATCC BAA-1389 / DSM 22839 / S5) TaxID=653733 RepID=E6W5J6_DESIS|nr:ribose-phosphate pyrophosphokinase [Desulfurispirillum indicum]ADU66027.1 ribose-phosphate pyrophosphokinase [Desulfurispirillum indicum S5]
MQNDLVIFSGNASKDLAFSISNELGLPLGDAHVGRFSDGEIRVKINENVRGRDVYIVQSTHAPVNDHLMELLIMCDALKRASVKSITAVVPYFGYARQDRKAEPRVPITAKMVADLMQTVGVSRVLTMDLHAGQIQGYFDIPVDNLYAMPILVENLRKKQIQDLIVVSPDAGGMERARGFAKMLNAGLAMIDKRRTGPNVSEVMNVIGDVRGKNLVIVDDIIDTAGTICKAVEALKSNGACDVYGLCTHAVLSGPAISRITETPFKEVIVTDTIALPQGNAGCEKIQTVSVSKLFAEAISRVYHGQSISSLFG